MWRSMGFIALSLAAIACAGTQARSMSVVVIEQDPSGDCQSLGEVVGMDTGPEARFDLAQDDALRKAAQRGATHFRVDRAKTGRTDPGTWTWIGTAYRCPVK